MDVTDLEAGTLTRKTAGTESRDTTLMCDFGQRVGLVHKLAELVGAEERVDDRRKSLGVDKVNSLEILVVAHIHTLTDSAGHTCQTDTELGRQLLTHSFYTAVTQVVNVINLRLLVDKLNKILYNRSDVLLCKHTHIVGDGHLEFGVDTVTSDHTKIIALVREEQFLNNSTRGFLIRRLCIAQLAVDVFDSLFCVVGRVLFEGVVYDSIVNAVAVGIFFDQN